MRELRVDLLCEHLRPGLEQRLTTSHPALDLGPVVEPRQVQAAPTSVERVVLPLAERTVRPLSPHEVRHRRPPAPRPGRARRLPRHRQVEVEAAVLPVLLIRGRQHRVQRVEALLAVEELVRPLGRLSHGLLILVTVDDLGGHPVGPAQQQRTHRIAGQQRVKQPSHPLDIPHLVPLHEREMPPVAPHSVAQQLTDRVLTRLVVRFPRDGRHGIQRLALLACDCTFAPARHAEVLRLLERSARRWTLRSSASAAFPARDAGHCHNAETHGEQASRTRAPAVAGGVRRIGGAGTSN